MHRRMLLLLIETWLKRSHIHIFINDEFELIVVLELFRKKSGYSIVNPIIIQSIAINQRQRNSIPTCINFFFLEESTFQSCSYSQRCSHRNHQLSINVINPRSVPAAIIIC